MNDNLNNMLRKLRLSGMAETLEIRLHEASGNCLTHTEFLELVLQDETLVRQQRQIARRVKMAAFRDLKSLEEFDWNFNPSIKKNQFYELATGHFLQEHRDVLICGAPGTGKSHLIQGVGYHLIKLGFVVLYRSVFDVVRDLLHDEAMDGHDRIMASYLKPDLLIIDDFGMKQLPKRSGEFLFEIVMRRHETRSTIMTTNRPIEDWGKLIGDIPTATAILDRFLHRSDIVTITGRSYRVHDRNKDSAAESLAKLNSASDDPKPAKAPIGSEESEKDSKPAKAPIGSATEKEQEESIAD